MNYSWYFQAIEVGWKEWLSYYITRFNEVIFGDLLSASNVELIIYWIVIIIGLGWLISFLFWSKE